MRSATRAWARRCAGGKATGLAPCGEISGFIEAGLTELAHLGPTEARRVEPTTWAAPRGKTQRLPLHTRKRYRAVIVGDFFSIVTYLFAGLRSKKAAERRENLHKAIPLGRE
jgi:hypothetical protein